MEDFLIVPSIPEIFAAFVDGTKQTRYLNQLLEKAAETKGKKKKGDDEDYVDSDSDEDEELPVKKLKTGPKSSKPVHPFDIADAQEVVVDDDDDEDAEEQQNLAEKYTNLQSTFQNVGQLAETHTEPFE